MNTDRPKIKVPLQPLDIAVDISSMAILVSMIIYSFMVYQDLPETIPTHFNFKGEADSFGNKSSLFLLPGISVALFCLLFIVNKYPYMHNYMVNITEENALKNYRFSTRIVRFTNLFIVLLFFSIQYMIVNSIEKNTVSIAYWLTPVLIGLSVIVPLFLVIYQYKMNK